MGEEAYVSCAHACVVACSADEPSIFAANCAHRAYYDSPRNDRIDLDLLADISMSVPMENLAEICR
jgi:hypothetical protein